MLRGLGVFAAKLDKVGIGLNEDRFTLMEIYEREKGGFIAPYHSFRDEAHPTAKDMVIKVLKARISSECFGRRYGADDKNALLQAAEKGFNKGYYGKTAAAISPAPVRDALASSVIRPRAAGGDI